MKHNEKYKLKRTHSAILCICWNTLFCSCGTSILSIIGVKLWLQAGCVHFTSMSSPQTCDIKVLILLYTSEKRAYLGFIPNDQAAFVDRLRKVIQHQKTTQALIRQQGGQVSNMNLAEVQIFYSFHHSLIFSLVFEKSLHIHWIMKWMLCCNFPFPSASHGFRTPY
jgi:hypothetical protein